VSERLPSEGLVRELVDVDRRSYPPAPRDQGLVFDWRNDEDVTLSKIAA
jgi:hypothetical protein